MNAGASRASGNILLFLHADTLLPQNYGPLLGPCLAQPNLVAGAFGFRPSELFEITETADREVPLVDLSRK